MDKAYLKSLIIMRQKEFPVKLYTRDNPLPIDTGKIITVPGVRRCGKTSKMENVVNRLLANGIEKERILWISFDDERLYDMKATDFDDIIQAYRELFPETEIAEVYMFFDEIQLIEGWEYFVMRIYKHYSKHIYISGSNATMLGSELKSVLRGWPLEEETYPLTFREFCRFRGIEADSWDEKDIARIKIAFHEYNNIGGFPEVVLNDNPLRQVKILQGYFETMMLRDLAEHYEVSNVEVLRYLIKRILVNLSKPTSVRNIHNDIKSRGLKVSKDELYKWIDYSRNIFLLIPVNCYNKSLSRRTTALSKYYCIDNGLRDAVLLPQSNDDGKKLENTVFLHLYENRTPVDTIFYYKEKQECDFVVQRGVEVNKLIQVSWDLSDSETRKREVEGLLEASSMTGCKDLTIITAEEEDILQVNGFTIKIHPAWKWLLGREG